MVGATAAAPGNQEELRCILEQQHQGHQQPINCMEVAGTTVLTGSQDHTLKVQYIKPTHTFLHIVRTLIN